MDYEVRDLRGRIECLLDEIEFEMARSARGVVNHARLYELRSALSETEIAIQAGILASLTCV